mgnify:CR=1 FL=1
MSLLELQAAHAQGRRQVELGDVLKAVGSTPIAVVVEVPDRVRDPAFGDVINQGSAVLEWRTDGEVRYTRRRLATLCRLKLVRVGEPFDDTVQARHRSGRRAPRAGDVLARPGELEREALIVEIVDDRARIAWLETGKTGSRAVRSLRWLTLVREGGEADGPAPGS